MLPPFEYGPSPNPQPASGQREPDPPLTPAEQRKLRRMISNRESARRSRMRKQRHLEDLRCHVSRLQTLNRELANRVGLVSHQTMLVRSDNDRLRSESRILVNRLSEIRRILMARQLNRLALPATAAICGGFGSGNELTLASLIA